jgi:hypothetical protein
MTPGVPAAYLGVLMSQATSDAAEAGAAPRVRRGRLARAARAFARAAQADVGHSAWKSDPILIEDDYYRLVNQPRGC